MQLTQDQVRAFVGPKADYYLERWHRIHEPGSRALGFNWAAFLFVFSWLLYRRMYRAFWVAVAIAIGWVIVETVALMAAVQAHAKALAVAIAVVDWMVSLLFGVMFGIYGSYWYFVHTRRQINQLTPDGQTDLQAVASMGGTNLWAGVISAAIVGFLAIWTKSATP